MSVYKSAPGSHATKHGANNMSSPNSGYDHDHRSTSRRGSIQTTSLDLSEDDDALWTRRPLLRIPTEDAEAFVQRRYLDSSQRYDDVENDGFQATNASRHTVHVPEPAEGDTEGNRAIDSLQDAHIMDVFNAYEQQGLGRVVYCMWCGVGDGVAHKVDCRYLHHLFTQRGFLRSNKDTEAPTLPTLLLEEGPPFPDILNPNVAIDPHNLLISHSPNTGQLDKDGDQDGAGAASIDGEEFDGLYDVAATAILSQLDSYQPPQLPSMRGGVAHMLPPIVGFSATAGPTREPHHHRR
ncbi:uncharacterized protein CLAFUR5_10875 [Fulvia fulva]|uniref:Uncharacterized protein n=1 Tax=Passalora fulva TaxID=5499 RepID=A0A9Q8PDT4_PASFU|nr:uncharacterized protein CLAFUR5_10875 [Fulvia fulva]UJO20610.1 hypothetical protein CLAFUR5_10875 [Fulvia fulva]